MSSLIDILTNKESSFEDDVVPIIENLNLHIYSEIISIRKELYMNKFQGQIVKWFADNTKISTLINMKYYIWSIFYDLLNTNLRYEAGTYLKNALIYEYNSIKLQRKPRKIPLYYPCVQFGQLMMTFLDMKENEYINFIKSIKLYRSSYMKINNKNKKFKNDSELMTNEKSLDQISQRKIQYRYQKVMHEGSKQNVEIVV